MAEYREYRLNRFSFELGLLSCILFGLAGIGSVVAALTNIDGSFGRPVLAAVILGTGWSGMASLGGFLVWTYYRHRLVITPESVRSVGVMTTREILFEEAQQAIWKMNNTNGKLKIKGLKKSFTINFENYSYQERRELIGFLHLAIADEQEKGWKQFEPTYQHEVNPQDVRADIKYHRRFMAVAWGIALPMMYVLLIWLKLNQGVPDHHWGFILIFPLVIYAFMVGGGWFTSRSSLFRLTERPPLSFDPANGARRLEGEQTCGSDFT